MEISYSNTSVWVWHLESGEQKKEGKDEWKMKKWPGKGTKETKKIMGKLLSEGPRSLSYTSEEQPSCQVDTTQLSQWMQKPLGSRRISFFNLFSNLLKPE